MKSRKTKTLALVILLTLLTLVACSDSTMFGGSGDTIPSQFDSAPPTPLRSSESSTLPEASISPQSAQKSSTPEHSQPQESILSSTLSESNINPDIENQNSDDSPVMSSQEAYALHEQWERNGYPNDVGGVYFDDRLRPT